jgi:hypothetical protein
MIQGSFQTCVKNLASKHFNLHLPYTSQSADARQILLDEVSCLLLVKIPIYIYPIGAKRISNSQALQGQLAYKGYLGRILEKYGPESQTAQNYRRHMRFFLRS